MKFAKGKPKPANSGRKKGGRNKRTIAAEARPDALGHLEKVMASTDPVITPDLRLRAAIALAQYQVAADFMTGGAPMAAEAYDRRGAVVKAFARREEETLPAFRERVREAASSLPERLELRRVRRNVGQDDRASGNALRRAGEAR